MSHTRKTKAQLIQEIETLQARVAALEPVEAAFQQSNEAFREFMEQSYDGFVLFDETGTIIEWNESQARITGISQEESLGLKTWDTLFRLGAVEDKTPENYKIIKNRALALLETGKAPWMKQSMERVIQRPDGGQRVVRSITFPIPTEKGFQIGSITRDITTRKHTEEALQESETRLHAIADTTPNVIYIYDTLENKNVWVNATHREVIGSIAEEDASDLTLESIAGRMHPDDVAALIERLEKLQESDNGKWLDVEYRLMTADENWHWFYDRASVFERDESGKVIQIIGSAIDITERKQAEEALEHSEREKAAILDSLSELVAYQDKDHRIIWANRAAGESIGIPPDLLAGRLCHEVWNLRGEPCEKCPIEAVWHSGKFEEGEKTTPDGRVWLIRGNPVHDENGELIGSVEVTLEITERKKTENELLKFKHIISVTDDLLALTNTNFEYQAISNSFLEYFGRTREEVIGRTAAVLLGEETFEKYLRPHYEQCMRGEVVHFQDWYDIPGRGRCYMDVAYHPLYGSQGAVEGVVVSTRDNTELKQAEEALRKSEARLTEAQTIAQIGSFEYNIIDDVQYWSKELYNILGFDPDQPPPEFKTFTSRIHPADRATVTRIIKQAVKDGTSPSIHYRYLIPDGLVKHIYARARITFDDQGRSEWLIGTVQDVTESKQAERALRENQRYLSQLMSNLPGVAYRMQNAKSWAAEFLSGGIYELAGYLPDDFLGDKKRAPADLIHPDDREAVWNKTQEALKKHQPYELTYRILTADGQEKWVWERGQGVFDKDGEVLALEGFITDISELKQTEQALRESEKRYRTLVEFAPVAISILGGEDKYIYVNPAWEQLNGYTWEDAEAMLPIELVHPDMRPLVQERAAARLRGETVPSRYELKTVTKDGETKWSDFSATLITIEGKPAILTLANDITDRRQAEEALRQERDKAQTYLDIVNAIVVAIDSDQQITLINQKGSELLGYREEEIIGKNWFDTFIPEADRDQTKTVFAQLMAGEFEPVEYHENPIVNKDGEERLIAWRNTVLRDEDGSIIGTLSSGEDITERKQAEQALRESEERYRILVEHSPISINLIQDGRYVFLNPTGARMLGFPTPEAAVGAIGLDHVALAYHEMINERVQKTIAGIANPTTEFEARRLDGTTFPFESTSVPIRYKDKPATLVIGQNITERKQAEQALRESEARYRTLFEQANDAILIENEDDDILDVNQRACELLGYTRDELLSMKVSQLQAPEHRGAEGQVIKKELELYSGQPFETVDVHRDGTRIPVEVTTSLLTGLEDGLALSIVRDITERKQAEQAYRSLVEYSLQGLNIVQDGYMVFANQALADMAGYTIEELLNLSPEGVYGLIHPDDRNFVLERAQKRLVGESVPEQYEFRFIRKDGTVRWLEQYTSLIEYNGKPAAQTAYVDITERKQAEQALKRSEATLRSIFRAAPIGMGLTTDRVLGWTNEYLQEMVGYSGDEMAGQNARMLYTSQEEYEQVGRNKYAQLKTQPVGTVETHFEHKEGHVIDILLSSSPIDPEDYSTGVVFTALDITERKRMEIAEREQRALAEALADTASVLSSTLDLNEVFDRILDNVGRVVPHDTADILLIEDGIGNIVRSQGPGGSSWIKGVAALRLTVDTAPNLVQITQTCQPMVIDDIRRYPGWISTAALDPFGLHAYCGVPILVGGEVIGLLELFNQEPGYYTDKHSLHLVTFAHQAAIAIQNAQLFEAERRERALAQTFQSISAGLNSPVSMVGTLDLIAGSLAEALDYEQVMLLMTEGDQLSTVATRGIDLSDPALKQHFAYPDNTALYMSMASGEALVISIEQEPGSSQVELPAFDPNSTRGWIGLPLIVADVVIGYLCVSTDKPMILKARDLEIVKAFAQQAEFVIGNSLILSELAISLTNLHETRERLLRAGRLSIAGEIAAGVAHQINNPLTTVVAQVYLLMKKLPSEHPGFKHVESIKQATYRAASVVQRMLDFGRPTPFIRKPLDINQSIESAISLVRAQIEPHIAQINLDLAPDLPPIKGSSQHLEDVWLNLLLNARDALTGREHGIINITTKHDVPHNAVTIVIKDNGPGIPSEDLSRVFDPFFTTKSHGTGLGLAICQDVIAGHNGTISVDSIDGQETTFTISLPV